MRDSLKIMVTARGGRFGPRAGTALIEGRCPGSSERRRVIDRARKFYEDTLGLTANEAMGGEVLEVTSGDTVINVYRSEFAGTNKATALTFEVDDIESEVKELKDKGIFFEHYDLPGLQQQGDLHVAEGFKIAWFKDPDGNILSIEEGGNE